MRTKSKYEGAYTSVGRPAPSSDGSTDRAEGARASFERVAADHAPRRAARRWRPRARGLLAVVVVVVDAVERLLDARRGDAASAQPPSARRSAASPLQLLERATRRRLRLLASDVCAPPIERASTTVCRYSRPWPRRSAAHARDIGATGVAAYRRCRCRAFPTLLEHTSARSKAVERRETVRRTRRRRRRRRERAAAGAPPSAPPRASPIVSLRPKATR